MLFKNLFTITENQSDIQPHKRLSSNLWMHDPDHEEGRKNDKNDKSNVDDENEKENDKDTEWQHALECYSQSILHGTCLRWSYCTAEQSCALTGTSKTAMQAHQSLTHVEVQSMGLKLYRKRMAKRHPAEARIALSILGFQGESRRQEFLGNKSSLSVYIYKRVLYTAENWRLTANIEEKMRQQSADTTELCALIQEPTQVPMRHLGTKSGRSGKKEMVSSRQFGSCKIPCLLK